MVIQSPGTGATTPTPRHAATAAAIQEDGASALLSGHARVVGGASGPLYGTALIEAGLVAGSSPTLDWPLIGRMLDAAAIGLARRGRCVVGDKTILDTLRPAADACMAGDTLGETLLAAWRGMRSTQPLVARRGLALRLGTRSAGHLDPGAVSCFILLAAMVR